MVWRLFLRRMEGAPPPAKQHPALEWLATSVHVGLYADLILAALVGLVAYFWLPGLGELHELMMRQILIFSSPCISSARCGTGSSCATTSMTRMIRPGADSGEL